MDVLSFELEILDLLSQRVIILQGVREPGKLSTYENMEDLTISDFKLVRVYIQFLCFYVYLGLFNT